MSGIRAKADKLFLGGVIALVAFGFIIFCSAAMGLLAREGAPLGSVAFNHIVFGIVLGSCALFVISRIEYRYWKQYAFYIFAAGMVLTCLVFVPGIGMSHGGATRWLNLRITTFQPVEFLKIGYLVYLAAWLSNAREKAATFKYGMVPFLTLSAIVGAVMLAQPDTDTFMIMVAAGLAMLFVAGVRLRYVFIMGLAGIALIAGLAFARPYIMDRIMTFINPAHDPLGSGYQIQQSLIAIGSGGIFGRGFGQSIQKFNYLPEPTGDSIFAVAGEEFGFVGGVGLIVLLIFFTLRGLKIANRAPDSFGRLLTVGIVILIVSQSFLNIGSMLGIMPLSGLPLMFVSQGGTAMLFALAQVGMVVNISRYGKKA